MFDIKLITLEDFNKYCLDNKRLCWQGLSDQSLDYLYHLGSVILPKDSSLVGIYLNNELICVTQFDWWTDRTGILHVFLKTQYQKSDILIKIKKELRLWLLTYTKWKKLIVITPLLCRHARMACKRMGFTLEGQITKSYVWRQKVTDLLIFGLNLEEE